MSVLVSTIVFSAMAFAEGTDLDRFLRKPKASALNDLVAARPRGRVPPTYFSESDSSVARAGDGDIAEGDGGDVHRANAKTVAGGARHRRQSTVACYFSYGMAGSHGCTQSGCALNVPSSFFSNLHYGPQRARLSCGLRPNQCYPGSTNAAGGYVGCCGGGCPANPYFGGKRTAVGALGRALNASAAARELVSYPTNDSRVVFFNPSWRMMTPYTRSKLIRLATFVEQLQGGGNLAVIITDGFTPALPNQDFTGVTALTHEGRELGMVIGARTSGLRRTMQQNAILAPTASSLNSMAQLQLLFLSDMHMRQLAEMAWSSGFNWMENVGPISGQPNSLPHLQVASVARTCGATIDLAFLLDGSGSVGLSGWQDQLEFMVDVVERFSPSPNGTHVSVSTFGGPRERDGAHFMPDTTNAANVSTGQPCNMDHQCHNLGTPHEVERCSVNTGPSGPNGTCYRLEGQHCPLGTAFASFGNNTADDVPSCLCPQNRTCLSVQHPNLCGQARYNASNCAGGPTNTDCDLRSYFNLSCTTCNCNLTSADWRWERQFSAWTDVNFSSATTTTTLAAIAQSGMTQYCPALTSPAWFARPTFCYPDAATHLSYGLRQVYESVFFFNQARHPSDYVPRVLITVSDGLANAFMEVDEWAAHLKLGVPDALPHPLPGVEMIAVGTNSNPQGNYLPQLTQLASSPIDRHMFRVGTPSDLQDLADEIGQVACAAPILIQNTSIELNITDPTDPGTNYFQFLCTSAANSTVSVVVNSTGTSSLIVASVINPTPTDPGIVTSTARGLNIARFFSTTGNVFVAVAATHSYSVQVFLPLFTTLEASVELSATLPSTSTALYTPTMTNPSAAHSFSIEPTPYFTLDSSTGAIGLTPAGAATLFDTANEAAFLANYTAELRSLIPGGCAPGVQFITFYRGLNYQPTASPTTQPTTATPSPPPVAAPTVAPSAQPTVSPTGRPLSPSAVPSASPTAQTSSPSAGPTASPTFAPTTSPSDPIEIFDPYIDGFGDDEPDTGASSGGGGSDSSAMYGSIAAVIALLLLAAAFVFLFLLPRRRRRDDAEVVAAPFDAKRTQGIVPNAVYDSAVGNAPTSIDNPNYSSALAPVEGIGAAMGMASVSNPTYDAQANPTGGQPPPRPPRRGSHNNDTYDALPSLPHVERGMSNPTYGRQPAPRRGADSGIYAQAKPASPPTAAPVTYNLATGESDVC